MRSIDQAMLSEEDIIKQAEDGCEYRTLVERIGNPGRLNAALHFFYMNGAADAQDGDVESPVGHFYRVHRWIVVTDNYGFDSIETYDTETDAIVAFEERAREYTQWAGEDQ